VCVASGTHVHVRFSEGYSDGRTASMLTVSYGLLSHASTGSHGISNFIELFSDPYERRPTLTRPAVDRASEAEHGADLRGEEGGNLCQVVCAQVSQFFAFGLAASYA
jgi:hypothetical protein